jgi:hypothetical protein
LNLPELEVRPLGRPACIQSRYRLSYPGSFFFNLHSGGWNQGPLDTAATQWPIVSAPGDYDNREIGGMIGRGNRSTRRKPEPVPLFPPQTPHAARTRIRAAAVKITSLGIEPATFWLVA